MFGIKCVAFSAEPEYPGISMKRLFTWTVFLHLLGGSIFVIQVFAQSLLKDWHMTEYEEVQALLSEMNSSNGLSITTSQHDSLQVLERIEWKNIPVVSNLLVQSEAADAESRVEILDKAARLVSEYKLTQIRSIMSLEQWQFVQQNRLNAQGPVVVSYDYNVRQQIGISDDQVEQIKAVIAKYKGLLDDLDRRLGRQGVAGFRPGDNISDRKQEVECIEKVMTALRADMNKDSLAIFTEEQRTKWDILVGNKESKGVSPMK